MDQFLSRLIESNRELLVDSVPHDKENLGDTEIQDDTDIRLCLTTLALAQNALRRLSLCRSEKEVPLQLVVIGPTQVGKSTLTNLLLQQDLAESNAEAGFTVHCQGFHVVDEIKDRYAGEDNWASEYFGELLHSPQRQLDRQILGEYSLQETKSDPASASDYPALFHDTVIWDTPDFDSIRSFDYRTPLVKAISLADLIVFVVSMEKYADKTVWTMLELLASLRLPVVMVMNKTPVQFRDELTASLEKKFTAALPQHELPPIRFIGEFPNRNITDADPGEIRELQQITNTQLQRASPEEVHKNTLGFLKEHWSSWTTSLAAEHRLQREYSLLVEKTAAETTQRYKKEYIDSDRHREVIQLALSELLVLLEVPGMAKPLSKIRSVVTWPVRTLIASSKEPASVTKDDRNEERRLLDELGKHAIARLIASVAKKERGPDGPWWQTMRQQITAAESGVRSDYDHSLDNYQTLLQVEIDDAAQSLYQNLQQQPATLNGLRAARVTADAAAVVLAVKSGGLGAVDLVLAPAMLSLTTLLTEGALGKYMERVQKKLTGYQEREVRSIINRKIARPLHKLDVNRTGDNVISEEELRSMTEKLESGDV